MRSGISNSVIVFPNFQAHSGILMFEFFPEINKLTYFCYLWFLNLFAEVNKLAERALMRLQQKLQGLEEGVAMSIEGQVNLLIQTARDPNNLCRLYAGWQPYL